MEHQTDFEEGQSAVQQGYYADVCQARHIIMGLLKLTKGGMFNYNSKRSTVQCP